MYKVSTLEISIEQTSLLPNFSLTVAIFHCIFCVTRTDYFAYRLTGLAESSEKSKQNCRWDATMTVEAFSQQYTMKLLFSQYYVNRDQYWLLAWNTSYIPILNHSWLSIATSDSLQRVLFYVGIYYICIITPCIPRNLFLFFFNSKSIVPSLHSHRRISLLVYLSAPHD